MSDATKKWIGRSVILLLALTNTTLAVVQLTTAAQLSGWVVLLTLGIAAAMLWFSTAGWLGTKSTER